MIWEGVTVQIQVTFQKDTETLINEKKIIIQGLSMLLPPKATKPQDTLITTPSL